MIVLSAMSRIRLACMLLVSLLVATACAATPSPSLGSPAAPTSHPSMTAVTAPPVLPPTVAVLTAASSPTPSGAPAPPVQPTGPQAVTFKGARSVALAAAADGTVYAALGVEPELRVTRTQDDGQTFSEPVRATGDIPAIVNPVERPSIGVDADGRVAVSWVEQRQGAQVRVWYSDSADDGHTFAPPTEVGRSQGREGTMTRIAFDAARNVLVTWLQDASLILARSRDRGASFTRLQTVDDEVCDCCQPAPLIAGTRVVVAYRNVVHAGADDLRDIYVVISDDGGATFGEPMSVSDASWRINACPISGPALVDAGERLYVAWMDGRNDHAQSGIRGDLWLAGSADGGHTFTPNVRINPVEEHLHTLPTMAVGPDGRLHISWELHAGLNTAIAYTTSDDHGATFAPPQMVAHSDDGAARGHPSTPSVLVTNENRVYLAWADRLGVHILSWTGTDAPPVAGP